MGGWAELENIETKLFCESNKMVQVKKPLNSERNNWNRIKRKKTGSEGGREARL